MMRVRKKLVVTMVAVLMVVFGVANGQAALEQEPNNSLFRSNCVTSIDPEFSGHLYPEGDQDWFKFEASRSATLNVNLSGATLTSSDNATWSIEVLDSNRNILGGTEDPSDDLSISLQSGGVYFIVLTNGDGYETNQSYQNIGVSVNSGSISSDCPVPDDDFDLRRETELNDDLATADSIVSQINGLDATFAGRLSSGGDLDFYKFYATVTGPDNDSDVTIREFQTADSGESNSTWTIQVRDPDGDVLESTQNFDTLNNQSFMPFEFSLSQSGTYYLVVQEGTEGLGYRFQVDGEILDNFLPIAEAGDGETIDEGQTVRLDATSSFDPDGAHGDYRDVTFQWEQTNANVNGTKAANLDNATSPTPSFKAPDVPPNEQVLTFKVTVKDTQNATSSDTVNITVKDTYDGSSSSGGCVAGGQDGAFGLEWLLVLMAPAVLARFAPHTRWK